MKTLIFAILSISAFSPLYAAELACSSGDLRSECKVVQPEEMVCPADGVTELECEEAGGFVFTSHSKEAWRICVGGTLIECPVK